MASEPRFGDVTAPIQDRIERVFHVRGRKRSPVVKLHAAAQMKNVRERIGRLPFFRQIAARNSLRVQFDQAAENQAVQSLRSRVGADPRIQIGGHRFDQKIDDAGFGGNGTGAGRKRKQR